MANDYLGFFLQGLAGGIQTGMNMGTQLQEMKWQKKQRKQLEETQAKMLEAGNIWNAKIKEVTADNTVTDEEIAQLNTVFLSGGYEFMEHYSSAMNYITGMKDKEYKQEIEWINLFISGIEGLPPGDVQAAYDYVKPKITSEKGLNMLEAYTNMQKKRYEVAQAQPTAEVFSTAGATQEAYPGAGYEYSATAKGYVPTYQKPTTPTTPPTELDKMEETKKWLDSAYATGNASYFNRIAKEKGVPTTFETYKQEYEKPEKVGAEKERVTSLPQLENYREKILIADTLEEAQKYYDDYADEYNESQLEINLPKDWVDVKQGDLLDLQSVLNEITAGTPEGRNIKGKKKYSFEINGKVTEKTGEEWYKQIYESYTALLKLLEEQGVDTSQYKKLKPLSEIKKASPWTSGFVGSGVEAGDLIKIYY